MKNSRRQKKNSSPTNEELTTLNEELRHTNVELGEVNNDLLNLLRSVNIPVVMVGRDLRIRRFTPAAQKTLQANTFGGRTTDHGIALGHPDSGSRKSELRQVIDSLITKEIEVQDKTGHWYSLLDPSLRNRR